MVHGAGWDADAPGLGIEQFAGTSFNPFAHVTSVDELPFGTPDEDITACVDAREFAEAARASIPHHFGRYLVIRMMPTVPQM